jgi:2-polyprenyl-3-methyl-5-hydroxy-6-metoxy-1,4-benzoquinol methylase/uncharacterized protein YbaR (Trm112 family)
VQPRLLDVLACPQCAGGLKCAVAEAETNGSITTASLSCEQCHQDYPVRNGIPRFVPSDNYASSFGYQWNLFRREQLDSYNGTTLSADRFTTETGWTKSWMAGKWVADIGCGAGRFLDIASQMGCDVVGVDISNAVDAARDNLKDRPNVHLVQASVYNLPFQKGVFDACYCIGVLQHTPDPKAALASLPTLLKKGGEVAVTIYEARPLTRLYSKYWLRPITRRMKPQRLFAAIRASLTVLFPVTSTLFRVPVLGRVFGFVIPVSNLVTNPQLSRQQRYSWALLDTFDMLAPAYDFPQTFDATVETLQASGVGTIRRLPNSGVNVVGVKN